MAIVGNFDSMILDKISTPALIKSKIKGEVVLKKDKNLFIVYYLKKLSTNSYLLNTCKSSIPSPTPIYFTGI